MKTLKDRLIVLKGDMGDSEFARKCNIKLGTMRKYLDGSMPGTENLVKIADGNCVTIEWLATGKGDKYPVSDRQFRETRVPYGRQLYELSSIFEQVPYLDVESAITGTIKADESMGVVLVSKRVIAEKGLDASKLYAVKPDTPDTLVPAVGRNADLVINLEDTQIADGKIYAFHNGKVLYTRRLQKQFDGGLSITADNPHIKDIQLPPDEADSVHIVGRVIFEAILKEV